MQNINRGMHVSELWRYPIKSMKGEPLEETTITSLGIPGRVALLSRFLRKGGLRCIKKQSAVSN